MDDYRSSPSDSTEASPPQVNPGSTPPKGIGVYERPNRINPRMIIAVLVILLLAVFVAVFVLPAVF